VKAEESMPVPRDPALPLYHQLKTFIEDQIGSGEWSPGHKLWTELQFANEFMISRTTVRQAMQLLQNEGLVERIQGKGTFVGRPKIAQNLALMTTIEPWRNGPDGAAELKVLYLEKVKAPPAVASRLNLLPTDQVFELKRTVVVDNEPLVILTCWLPEALFPDFDSYFSPERSLRNVLRVFYGVEAIRQHKEVEVTILAPQEARLLQSNPGAPALLVSYLSRSQADGTPVEFRRMIVRGDRCKYYVEMESPELLV
jgi:GntR family transcriptional regulator